MNTIHFKNKGKENKRFRCIDLVKLIKEIERFAYVVIFQMSLYTYSLKRDLFDQALLYTLITGSLITDEASSE